MKFSPVAKGFGIAMLILIAIAIIDELNPNTPSPFAPRPPGPYGDLEFYLQTNQLQSADHETNLLLHKGFYTDGGPLQAKHVKELDCEHLQEIDDLWFTYSGGRLGFSVQREIYEAIEQEYDSDLWEHFGTRVGWRTADKRLGYYDFSFELTESTPCGQLPLYWHKAYGIEARAALLDRVRACGI